MEVVRREFGGNCIAPTCRMFLHFICTSTRTWVEQSLTHSPTDSQEEQDVCWICLDDSTGETGKETMMSPCLCPRRVHPKCLARWQLQQAGRPEETHCRWGDCDP